MKLLKDIIVRRVDVMKDLELNNQNFKAIWHFYEIYKICINISGIVDDNLNKKKSLLIKLLHDPENMNIVLKLKSYISQDSNIVEFVLNNLVEMEETLEILEDFYPCNIIGVNLDERGI